MKIIPKSWGRELILENGQYCMKLLEYTKPIASSLHYHNEKLESFYVASGRFEIEIGSYEMGMSDEGYIVASPVQTIQNFSAGSFITLPPRTHHRVRCIEPGVIVEASTHDDPEDCVRLVPSET